ncbi:hypothetical protein HYH02_000636 [Chlamydomonas schloesseri]|uniref:Uncharacterized protein n=1 Tax=Chlamydomonas schloesseri TaxID=2026947 RepID=A0A835WWN2_9CHLO|nr:hypothetical protein HYH02_000636 [Chlamydomonas schloesseri]|eukprot:KAG2454804.1 hypothetical protein HYH02_000636 [Chlamydomonas schloesseri]
MTKWTKLAQAGSVPIDRSSHSITVIDNKVYLFGGEHDPRVPVGNELYEYDMATGTWRVVEVKGEAPPPRVAHAAAAVGSTLYVFGGRDGRDVGEGASNQLHAFDTTTSTWRLLAPAGSPPPQRSYHTMTSLGHKLYVFGGCGEKGRLNDLHQYDTATNTWTPLAVPSAEAVPGRGGSCLVPGAVGGGKQQLFVVAGFCGRELDDMHVYSVPDNTWCGSACPSCHSPVHEHEQHHNNSHDHDHAHAGAASPAAAAAAASCGGGKLPARSVFGAGVHECGQSGCEHDGALLVYGGEVDPSDKGHDGAGDFCASLMEFGARGPAAAAAAGGWRPLEAGGDSPGPRGWFAATTTPDGRLLLHGGLDGNNQRLGDMYVLDVHA